MHVGLGGLEVVVEVVAESREKGDGLVLPAPLHVLGEDHCRPRNDCMRLCMCVCVCVILDVFLPIRSPLLVGLLFDIHPIPQIPLYIFPACNTRS